MMSNRYELIEEKLFSKELQKIGNIKYVDEALSALYDLLSLSPEEFPIVAGTDRLRLTKTKAYEREGVIIPPLRIFFIIEITDDGRFVMLKYIETIEYEFDD
jgi:hypothetical protein